MSDTIATTPAPPYYAVIFTSLRSEGDRGYGHMAERMLELAAQQPGFLGVETARTPEGLGITVSYWTSEEAIGAWKAHAEHQVAQETGRRVWYSAYQLRVACVERAYGKQSVSVGEGGAASVNVPIRGDSRPAQTTEANQWVVREFVDAVNRQDWRRFDELVAPEFVRHSSTYGQSQINNRDRLRDYLVSEFRTFPDARESIHFLVAEGDKVTVHSHLHATQQGPLGALPATGRVLSADFISIYRIAEGRIVEAWAEWDALNGLIQLGHLQPPRLGGDI